MKVINVLKVIALIEVVLGILLLLAEIKDYIHFPSVQEANEFMGGIVDFHKYEEDCYSSFYLYLLMIFAGTSFWMNKKIYAGLAQVLLITLFYAVINELERIGLSNHWTGLFLEILSLMVFAWLETKWNSMLSGIATFTKAFNLLCFAGGGLSCAIWVML